MRPDKTTIYDLFDRQRRYAVPLYQRQYVWNREVQWPLLWQDVEDRASLVQRQEARAPHFLGAIVTSQTAVFGSELNTWEIIDGQQRLTTLQVLLTAFGDVAVELGITKFKPEILRLTRNAGVMKDDFEQFKVWPTNSDRSVFRTVMEAGSLKGLARTYPGITSRQKRQVPRLAEAYEFFFSKIDGFVNESDQDRPADPPSRLDVLFETFRRYLQIVNIELESGDDPQVIFESLNGRGVQPLPSDLVRNLVFMRAARAAGATPKLDVMYEKYWRPYDDKLGSERDSEPWWKQEERQGRFTRPRLDLFLFHYLQFRIGREVNIGHLFQEFRNWWDAAPSANTEASLAEMQRYSAAFSSWISPEGRGRRPDFFRRLKVLDTATVYPVLFLLLVDQASKLTELEIGGLLEDIESYLLRREMCGLTKKAYNRFFLTLLNRLRDNPRLSRSDLRSFLAAGKGESTRWPDDEEFGRAFVHRPAYRAIKRGVVNSILLALEDGIKIPKNERFIDDELSIEHVLPQEWEKHWPLAGDSGEVRELRERLLHAFGNLTLVTPQFNTALSNKEFSRKQKEIKRTSLLRLNQYFDERDAWNEAEIIARGKALFETARHYWPHPASETHLDVRRLDTPPDGAWKGGDSDSDEETKPAIDLNSARGLLDAFAAAQARRPLTPAS